MAKPLDELEMTELMWAAYPDRFNEDTDPEGEAALQFVDEMEGFDAIADLLGRVVMLTIPSRTAITGDLRHALGKVEFSADGSSASMIAAVSREVINGR